MIEIVAGKYDLKYFDNMSISERDFFLIYTFRLSLINF